jgi:hypothetical protein
LGCNLAELLIEVRLDRHTEDVEDVKGQALARQGLLCLLELHRQFDSARFDSNRVLEVLFEHPRQSEIGQALIGFVNRAESLEDLARGLDIIRGIYLNPALASSFFYRSDEAVLAGVLGRLLLDLPEKPEESPVDQERREVLMALRPLVRHSPSFRKAVAEGPRPPLLNEPLAMLAEHSKDPEVAHAAAELRLDLQDILI